ncbi:MAG TPA: efflux RND transporter permease subunit [Pseudogracilibacillus sp.]|nr:efflux RND transporter permease subunit [Pseudogracilibacillus sp.]
MKLTNLSIKRPKLTIVGMILFILLGAVSLTKLPLQLFPEIDPPVAAVVSSYEGASPEEVEDKVTKPLEEELSTLPELDRMTSTSEEGMTLVLLEFDWSSSIDDVEQDIITSMNQAEITDDANDPQFMKFDPSMMGMNQLAVTSDESDDVVDFQDDVEDFQTELERMKGVANVDQSGGLTEEFLINLDQDKLKKNHLTQDDIVQLIQTNENAVPGGTVETDDKSLSTRVLSTIDGEDGLKDLEIDDDLTLSDVADVKLGTEKQTAITRANQSPALQLTAMKESDANSADVSDRFNDKLDDLLDKEEYEDLSVTSLFDEGEFINQSIDSVTTALILGAVFAMIVLFFFLRNLKTPLIIGIAIPFSVIVTFAFLYFTDVSLNIMTLGGLALGIGMLVDNAIVVIENIYRHLSMGKTPRIAASEGTKEVGGAITASTLTTIVVFLPIVFISGIVGNIFTEFALTIAFSLIASLFVALTVVPMIASRVLTAPDESKESERQNSRSMNLIERSVNWVLSHRFITIIIVTVLLAVGGLGLAKTGVNFLPATDQGFFSIDIEMENGTKLEKTTDTVEDIEDILESESDVKDYMALAGNDEETSAMDGPSGSDEASMFVSMKDAEDRDQTTLDFVEDIEDEVEGVDPDADISLSTEAAVGGGEANTAVFTLSDKKQDRLDDASDDIQDDLEDENTVREVTTSEEERAPEMQIDLDDDKVRDHGLTPGEVAQTVDHVTRGETATTIQSEDDDTFEVVVKYDDEHFDKKDNLDDLLIPNSDGDYIALKDLADLDEGDGPTTLNRLDQEPSTEFTVTYTNDTNLNEISTTIEDIIDDADLEDTTSYAFTGEQDLLDDAVESLGFAFILALLFIYLVMAGQFESFKYPFVVMFSVPLIAIGIMLALTLTQTPLSVTVFIGVIVLAGIVVNNGIVLIDYINQLKARGMPSRDAIVEGVKQRTRPILMTALTTILGVVPLALGIGEGTEIQQPMGISVIGGLISSTFLTLFIVPVLYSFLDKETRIMNRQFVTADGTVISNAEIEQNKLEKQTNKMDVFSQVENKEKEQLAESDTASSKQEAPEEEKGETKQQEPEEETETEKEDSPSPQTDDVTNKDILNALEKLLRESKDSDDKNE